MEESVPLPRAYPQAWRKAETVTSRHNKEDGMKRYLVLVALAASTFAQAAVPPILAEACNLFPQAAKRAQCLQAADQQPGGMVGSSQQRSLASQTPSKAGSTQSSLAAKQPKARTGAGGSTCYTGPRGGTYTITPSGRKNYNGC